MPVIQSANSNQFDFQHSGQSNHPSRLTYEQLKELMPNQLMADSQVYQDLTPNELRIIDPDSSTT